jgi:hypothetical protein
VQEHGLFVDYQGNVWISGAQVADVAILAPAAAGRIFAPPRNVDPFADAVTAACGSQQDAVSAIGLQAYVWRRVTYFDHFYPRISGLSAPWSQA